MMLYVPPGCEPMRIMILPPYRPFSWFAHQLKDIHATGCPLDSEEIKGEAMNAYDIETDLRDRLALVIPGSVAEGVLVMDAITKIGKLIKQCACGGQSCAECQYNTDVLDRVTRVLKKANEPAEIEEEEEELEEEDTFAEEDDRTNP